MSEAEFLFMSGAVVTAESHNGYTLVWMEMPDKTVFQGATLAMCIERAVTVATRERWAK